MQVFSTKEIAVCNLASLCLPKFVKDRYSEEELLLPEYERRTLNHEFPLYPYFDYDDFLKKIQILIYNLNQIIDKNWYPLKECRTTNLYQRPMGIGVQGLADVYLKFRLSWNSQEANRLNKNIFEALYYGALSGSTTLSKELYRSLFDEFQKLGKVETSFGTFTESLPYYVGSYPGFIDSPISKGIFHWEMSGLDKENLSGKFDWETLRSHILKYGVRNSLLIALMPTASTSQIMGNSECIEPYTENIFFRSTLHGDFTVINKYLVNELKELNLWTPKTINWLKSHEGSIKDCPWIPDNVQSRYLTVFELSKLTMIKQSADRGHFIDQSQSFVMSFNELTIGKFTTAIFKGWELGLKTASYYLRTRSAIMPQKINIYEDDSDDNTILYNNESFIGRDLDNLNRREDPFCLLCGS